MGSGCRYASSTSLMIQKNEKKLWRLHHTCERGTRQELILLPSIADSILTDTAKRVLSLPKCTVRTAESLWPFFLSKIALLHFHNPCPETRCDPIRSQA